MEADQLTIDTDIPFLVFYAGGGASTKFKRNIAESLKKKKTHKVPHPPPEKPNVFLPHTSPRAARFNVGSKDFVVFSISILLEQIQSVLTRAELDVCSSLLQGKSNNEIALARGTAPRTVANQVASIFRKLQVCSRAELAVRLEASRRTDGSGLQ